jgi:hypothetical protein
VGVCGVYDQVCAHVFKFVITRYYLSYRCCCGRCTLVGAVSRRGQEEEGGGIMYVSYAVNCL